VIEAAPGLWLYYCYNAEYLFFPFCETRTIGEMLTFHEERTARRHADLCGRPYAGDLDRFPDAVSLDAAWIDRSGYYALGRPTRRRGHPKERQLDFFGGLRWRFEEHVPANRRKIDRIALFRAQPGLRLRGDHTFSDEEYNTYACPWHHNLTAAIVSFRTAKALKTNPGSTFDIKTFRLAQLDLVPFEWRGVRFANNAAARPRADGARRSGSASPAAAGRSGAACSSTAAPAVCGPRARRVACRGRVAGPDRRAGSMRPAGPAPRAFALLWWRRVWAGVWARLS
jgi:hypothetical protein